MSTYETVIVVGMVFWVLMALGLLIALVYMVQLLRRIRGPIERFAVAFDQMERRLDPAIRRVDEITRQTRSLVDRVFDDIDDVSDALQNVSASTTRMVDMVEDRVADATALMSVVQEEAEETFFSTAALLSGLRPRDSRTRIGRLRRAMEKRRR